MTEIYPRRKLRLTPLLDRDEYAIIDDNDRDVFREDERKIVTRRREEYARRVSSASVYFGFIEFKTDSIKALLEMLRSLSCVADD